LNSKELFFWRDVPLNYFLCKRIPPSGSNLDDFETFFEHLKLSTMLVKLFSAAGHGVDASTITVEVNAGGSAVSGKINYWMVGLPDNAIKEGWIFVSEGETCDQFCSGRYPQRRFGL
jgi:hypothetical protein